MDHPEDPRVPRPCSVPLATMAPHARGRFCGECGTLVLDTSKHTRAEVLDAVARGGRVCARLQRDDTGRVVFRDSPLRRRLSVLAVAATLAACGEREPEPDYEPMGEVEMQPHEQPTAPGPLVGEEDPPLPAQTAPSLPDEVPLPDVAPLPDEGPAVVIGRVEAPTPRPPRRPAAPRGDDEEIHGLLGP